MSPVAPSHPARVLLTGGARSGKSTAAENLLADAPSVTYVATAPPGDNDEEWTARIAQHRARRPEHWHTVETDDVATQIARATSEHPVLVDCLTLWLTSRMDHHRAWNDPSGAMTPLASEIDALAAGVAHCSGRLVVVTNEVGSGIVPADRGTRLFRDLLGRLNCAIAAQCDEVYLVVAGRFLRLERNPRG